MSEFGITRVGSQEALSQRAGQFMGRVYGWMTAGVGISAVVAYFSVTTGLLTSLLTNFGRGFIWGTLILQLGIVLALSSQGVRARPTTSRALFIVYSLITGLTLGVVTFIYTLPSILAVFLVAVAGFAGLALVGVTTKRDLGPIGTFCIMGVWMVIGASVLQLVLSYFAGAASYIPPLNFAIGAVGILVFSGLTAWESQRLKSIAYAVASGQVSADEESSYVTMGALSMYLNFINLFLSLLRVFGNRR